MLFFPDREKKKRKVLREMKVSSVARPNRRTPDESEAIQNGASIIFVITYVFETLTSHLTLHFLQTAMLRQSCRAAHLRRKQIAPRVGRAHVSTSSSSAGSSWRDRNASEKLGPVALVIGATVLSYSYAKARPVRNDAIVEPSIEKRDRRTSTRPGLGLDSEHLSTVAWGSNKCGFSVVC